MMVPSRRPLKNALLLPGGGPVLLHYAGRHAPVIQGQRPSGAGDSAARTNRITVRNRTAAPEPGTARPRQTFAGWADTLIAWVEGEAQDKRCRRQIMTARLARQADL